MINNLHSDTALPTDIVLAPAWWNKNIGITFDEDFFFHPLKRVEVERKMEKILYDRWGKYGLGMHKYENRPEVGAVHLAAGFLLSEMLGCEIRYNEDSPPQVLTVEREGLLIDVEKPFKSECFKRFEKLINKLQHKYNRLTGDVNWSGILNLAMDIRGQNIFIDMFERPEEVLNYFKSIKNIIDKFVDFISNKTNTSSISVNRNVRHFRESLYLHSECSHTMISVEDYKKFLLPIDIEWSKTKRPFGIHYCGSDPHRYAEVFAEIPHLDFLDVGWGGDIEIIRKYLPKTFLNIRMSPVEIINQSVDEIKNTVINLIKKSANPFLTGVCCINMDHNVSDEKIDAIFEAVSEMREYYYIQRRK